MAEPPTKSANYWIVAAPDPSVLKDPSLVLPLEEFTDTIRGGDIAFMRVGGELVGWARCEDPEEEDGYLLRLFDAHLWNRTVHLTTESTALWSLSYFRDPDHAVHGLSGREARLLYKLSADADESVPQEQPEPETPGTIDEVLLVAAELAEQTRPGLREDVKGESSSAAEDARQVGESHIVAALVGLGVQFPGQFPVGGRFVELAADSEIASQSRLTSGVVDISDLPVFRGPEPVRSALWFSATRHRLPSLDEEASSWIAVADAFARALPQGSAATEAHLLGAFLGMKLEPDSEAGDRQITEHFVDAITDGMESKLAADWRVAVGLAPQRLIVAPIDSDSADGADKLNRMPDISAFANAIASRALQPPLSIGIFGEWGSGKTFFMRKLRNEIDLVNEYVHNFPKDQPIGYCERIAQVEFNAWHYAEAELWPSLIHHLLGNLKVGHGDEAAELTDLLLDHLQDRSDLVAAREAELKTAQDELTAAEKHVTGTQLSLETARAAALEFGAKDAWDLVKDHPEIRESVNELRGRFGEAEVGDAAADLYDAVTVTIDTVQSGWNVLRLREQDATVETNLKTALFLRGLVAVAAVAVAYGIEVFADSTAVAGVIAFLGPVSSGMNGLTRWLKVQNERGDKVVDGLKAARNTLIAERDAEVANFQLARDQADTALAAARRSQVAAGLRLQKAKAAEAAAAKAVEMTPDERLAEFVKSRLANYRSHLGLVTTVREDFEKLGKLLESIRSDADAARHPAEPADEANGVARLDIVQDKGGQESETDEGLNIDRIVVYIDDLDRCKPKTVVEVLEAIHLLLAFEFIVVVVGVDARWVGRSLLEQYPTLLGTATESERGPEPIRHPRQKTDPRHEVMQRPASEHDYIEKIFQVPYWLEPMTPSATGDLVNSLFGQAVGVDIDRVELGSESEDEDDRSEADGPFTVSEAGRASIAALHQRLDEATGFDPNPIGLAVTNRELEFMDVVYPLVSRSPRSAKRFVNIYRVIKAGLSDADLERWIGPDKDPAPHQAVIMLLALVCGAPQSSTAVLGLLAELDSASWETIAKNIETAMAPFSDELRRWNETRMAYETGGPVRVTALLLKTWLPRVAQFSFRSGHLDLITS